MINSKLILAWYPNKIYRICVCVYMYVSLARWQSTMSYYTTKVIDWFNQYILIQVTCNYWMKTESEIKLHTEFSTS